MRYADDIFRTGRELLQAVKGMPTGERLRLVVGVADVIPKRVAARLLQPALSAAKDVALVCREGPLPRLLGELAQHELDVVLADAPAPEAVKVRAFSHLLGECGVAFLAAPAQAHLRKGFPRSLDGAALRRALDEWFEAQGVRPVLAGEFDDDALLAAFGSRGLGFFAAPSVIEKDVTSQLEVVPIGHAEEVRERFYAISVERRLRHPAVVAMAESARERTFR